MAAPSRKDRTKPAELLGLSAGFAVFAGLIALMSTRDFVITLVAAGLTFILSLMTLAMLALATRPNPDERSDLDEQNKGH